ncbi:NAD(P)/FAD-dependent oxidoreductase [Sphingomonas sp. 1P06PA]|uniref:NAD(P)/FAD-dependent oxidoreductase n=1 Tax=Sphingomonas sp. 1P06PA TaxID=554121 RepID=UPI0039A577CC
MTETIDALVIGGGPAGLTAAIYLARFHLAVAVVDAGHSRAALIPVSHNHAGHPGGIAGVDLLARMRRQGEDYGALVRTGTVAALARNGKDFIATLADGDTIHARAVLLATGVVNRRPAIDDAVHDEALARGLLRYCPICDGYEVTDKRVGVIGTGGHGLNEALFLRGFTRDVTLISPDSCHDLDDAQRAELAAAGIALHDGPCHALEIEGDALAVPTADGRLTFDSVYPALGSDIRSELAVAIGAAAGEGGCIAVDAHQRTDVPGLFAAGDVVIGLDQISHAMGAAGIAATTIRNDLAERRPLRR